MTRFQFMLLMVLCIIFSFLGGIISSFFFGTTLFAQNTSKDQKILIAEEFRVVDKDGNIRAIFGIANYRGNKNEPEIRLLTPAYGEKSGILISASKSSSEIKLYGESSGISMNVFSHSKSKTGDAKIQVLSRPYLDLLSNEDLERDSSRIELQAGVGTPTRMSFYDDKDIVRATLGEVTLEKPSTGSKTSLPSSLVFFNKKGVSIWSAP